MKYLLAKSRQNIFPLLFLYICENLKAGTLSTSNITNNFPAIFEQNSGIFRYLATVAAICSTVAKAVKKCQIQASSKYVQDANRKIITRYNSRI